MGAVLGASIGATVGGLFTAPIGGVGAIATAAGGAALGAWIGTLVDSRRKMEKHARLKIKEMLEKERSLLKKLVV